MQIDQIDKTINQPLDTRKILIQNGKTRSQNVYYLPGFMRLKVKNFISLQLQSLDAAFNGTLIYTIYYGTLSRKIVKKIKKNIILLFERDDAIKLCQQKLLQLSVKDDDDKKQITFSLRKVFHARLQSQVFWSPFQIINLILNISVQAVTTKWGTVKFNLMDTDNQYVKISYTDQGAFGNYDLAEKRMKVQYTNIRQIDLKRLKINKQQHKTKDYEEYLDEIQKRDLTKNKQKSKGIKRLGQFQFAHFNTPLYKFPLVALVTIFAPLWFIACLNMGIFFQTNNVGQRIGSIAPVIVGIVELLPVIRQQIPPSPHLVFIQFLVYIQTTTCILALVHSIIVKYQDKSYSMYWRQSVLFLMSFAITLIQMTIIIGMMLLHYFKWQPSYNKDEKSDEQIQKARFNRLKWKNECCDIFFNRLNDKQTNPKKKIRQYPDQQNHQLLHDYDKKRCGHSDIKTKKSHLKMLSSL